MVKITCLVVEVLKILFLSNEKRAFSFNFAIYFTILFLKKRVEEQFFFHVIASGGYGSTVLNRITCTVPLGYSDVMVDGGRAFV